MCKPAAARAVAYAAANRLYSWEGMMTAHVFETVVRDRFGGLLRSGSHRPDGLACVLEAVAAARGLPWTDSPVEVGLPDLRPLNDARWSSDAVRTAALVPVVVALWKYSGWTKHQRTTWICRVVERTIREVLPVMLRYVGCEDAAIRCEREGTATAAYAAYTAADAAARSAAYAAYAAATYAAGATGAAAAAASAASAAAYAAAAAADRILQLTCRIWQEEALSCLAS